MMYCVICKYEYASFTPAELAERGRYYYLPSADVRILCKPCSHTDEGRKIVVEEIEKSHKLIK